MAWVERRGRLWRGKYRDAEGKVRFAGSSQSKRTAKQLASLKEAFGEVELRNITPRMVQRWVIELQKQGVKPSTFRAKYRALATVLGARRGVSAVRDGLIPRTPCHGIDLPVVDTGCALG